MVQFSICICGWNGVVGSITWRNYKASKQEIYLEMVRIGLSKLRTFGQMLNRRKRGGG